MKNVVKTLGIAAGLFAVVTVSAQQRDFGSDPSTCQRNLSLYDTDFKMNNYDAAIVYWRKIWRDCPLASINLTLQGAQMYKYYIDRELNADRKNALVDTLMQVWEKGIALRPQAAVNYRIGMMQDMLKYNDTPEISQKF